MCNDGFDPTRTLKAVPWWFASVWNTGGYRKVNENVGDLIDWVSSSINTYFVDAKVDFVSF